MKLLHLKTDMSQATTFPQKFMSSPFGFLVSSDHLPNLLGGKKHQPEVPLIYQLTIWNERASKQHGPSVGISCKQPDMLNTF